MATALKVVKTEESTPRKKRERVVEKKEQRADPSTAIIDRVWYMSHEVRKVLGTVTMVAQQVRDPEQQNAYDEGAVFGFCELLEDRLRDIHEELESIIHALDEQQGPTDRSVPIRTRRTA